MQLIQRYRRHFVAWHTLALGLLLRRTLQCINVKPVQHVGNLVRIAEPYQGHIRGSPFTARRTMRSPTPPMFEYPNIIDQRQCLLRRCLATPDPGFQPHLLTTKGGIAATLSLHQRSVSTLIRTSNTHSSNTSGTHPSAPAPACCTWRTGWPRAGSRRIRKPRHLHPGPLPPRRERGI